VVHGEFDLVEWGAGLLEGGLFSTQLNVYLGDWGERSCQHEEDVVVKSKTIVNKRTLMEDNEWIEYVIKQFGFESLLLCCDQRLTLRRRRRRRLAEEVVKRGSTGLAKQK
jgi:hypothetical protein